MQEQRAPPDLNMSVDFANLMNNKNYMRLTTSANKRYQTSEKFQRYYKIRGSLNQKLGDQQALFSPPASKGIKNLTDAAVQKEKAVRRID